MKLLKNALPAMMFMSPMKPFSQVQPQKSHRLENWMVALSAVVVAV